MVAVVPSPAGLALVGREPELETLAARWQTARGGTLQVARVVGSAGVGKTALLGAVAALASTDGALVVQVRGRPASPALATVARITRAVVDAVGRENVEQELGADGEIAVALATGGVPEPHRVADAVERLLETAARARPIALLVDDAHHLDEDSRRLLRDLIDDQPPVAALLVLAERDEPGDVAISAGPGRATTVHVDGLSGDALRALVERETGTVPDLEVVDAVERVSGGIPAFALDLLRARGLERLLAGEPAPVPDAVQAIAERRLTHVAATDPDVLPHLRVAAVLGDRIAPDVVAAVAPMGDIPVQELLRRASESRLVHCTASGAWRFTPGARDALAAGVANEEAARLHRSAADLLTRSGPVLAGGAARVARHLLSAAELGDEAGPDAVAWALRATDEALRTGDARTAARLCGRSLALVPEGDLAARAALLIRLGTARWATAGATAARAEFAEAADAAEGAEANGELDPTTLARHLADAAVGYARTAEIGGVLDATGRGLLDRAASALQALRPDALGRSSTNAALVLWAARGLTPESAVSRADAAAAHARTATERALAALARARMLTGPGDADARLEAWADAAREAERARDLPLAVVAQCLHHAECLRVADRGGADASFAALTRFAATGHLGIASQVAAVRAARAVVDGRPDEADRCAAEARKTAPLGDEASTRAALAVLAFARGRDDGTLEQVVPDLYRVADERPGEAMWPTLVARCLTDLGRRGEARATVARYAAGIPARASGDTDWLVTTTALAECAARLVPDAAARFAEALEPWSDELVVWGGAGIVLGSVARTLGELDLAAGRRVEARARFDAARALESALGSAIAVRSSLLAAGVRASSPEAADRDEAEQLRADALDAARDHGLHALAAPETAARAATPLLPPPPPPAAAATATATSPNGGGAAVLVSTQTADTTTAGTTTAGTTTAGTTTDVRCFGAFALRVGGAPVELSGLSPRLRGLVWYFALHAGKVVHDEQLIDALWPDTDLAAGRRNLQVAVSSLRQVLEPGGRRGAWTVLAREGEGYRLQLGPGGSSDLRTFELAAADARATRDPDAAARALAAYGGELIPEAGPTTWLAERRDGCRKLAADAALLLAEARMAAGDHTGAAEAGTAGLAIDRYVDGLWRILIGAAEARGDHAVAARIRKDYDAVLEELGVT
jgi:DNA-binding SARP family transcriptional activator